MIRHNKKLLIEVSATVVLLRPKGMETWRIGVVWNGFHAVKTHHQESASVMELAPMARSSQGCPCAGSRVGKMWWRERRAEGAATRCCFKISLLTQVLAHQQGAIQNGWAMIARFLGMFLFLLIIKERVLKVRICSRQLIEMRLSHSTWSARVRPVKNRSFYS